MCNQELFITPSEFMIMVSSKIVIILKCLGESCYNTCWNNHIKGKMQSLAQCKPSPLDWGPPSWLLQLVRTPHPSLLSPHWGQLTAGGGQESLPLSSESPLRTVDCWWWSRIPTPSPNFNNAIICFIVSPCNKSMFYFLLIYKCPKLF